MNKILALDQSSKITGYSIFDNNKLLDYGKYDCGDADLPVRLTKIRNHIKHLILDYNIEKVILEDIQLQNNVSNNVKTYKALAEVIGVITQLCNEMSIPHELIASSTWKSNLGIKGRNRAEQKRNAQNWVVDKYKIKPTQDECDSICIGYYYTSQDKTQDYSWAD